MFNDVEFSASLSPKMFRGIILMGHSVHPNGRLFFYIVFFMLHYLVINI